MSKISEMFDYFPGNHRLTEEIVYNYQPTSPSERVPLFSGSQDNIVPIGYIRKGAYNKAGEKVTYFEGPCLILTKDGSAGLLTYRDEQDGLFTINHHACVLKLKAAWLGKVDLEWFATQYKKKFTQYVTSKSDNRVFSTDWFDRIDFQVPDYSVQLRQKAKRKKLVLLAKELNRLSKYLETISKSTQVVCDDGELHTMGDVVDFVGGNSGLTEEFIYSNQPNEEEKIPILSSATLDINLMGYVSRNGKPDGKDLRLFVGPCILVARNGYAGSMKYIGTGQFTTNDHAYVLTPKKAWQNELDLRWFVHEYQSLFYNLVTSKSDNATFNKEYAGKQTIRIPDMRIQRPIAGKLLLIDKTTASIHKLRTEIEKLTEYEIH